jgi:methylmalonyl-CoA mutase
VGVGSKVSDMTDDLPMTLADDFPAATSERWRVLVDAVLAKGMRDPSPEDLGRRFERDLVSRTYDGFTIQPIYTGLAGDVSDPSGFPGLAPFVRGRTPLATAIGGWDVCQRVEVSGNGEAAGPLAVAELEGGASSVWLGLTDAHRLDVDTMDRALAGVYLELIPLRLDAGRRALEASEALFELWRRRGIEPEAAQASLGLDPLGAALAGVDEKQLVKEVDEAAAFAERVVSGYPGVRTLVVDGVSYHQAGASDSEELGSTLAAGVTYLRALTGAGLPLDAALAQLECRYAATADQFLTIAKLRAARRLWSRVGDVIGAAARHWVPPQHAVTSPAMLSAYDPWVNLLRNTVACFAAGVGGAEAVTVLPHDRVSSGPSSSDLGRRLARNIQGLLLEESHLARVVDPAGGSWYVESLTEQLARAAWAWFQQIEASGGMVAGLAQGLVQARLDATWQARADRLARGADPITGVSEFPNIDEPAPPVPVTAGPRRYPAAFEVQRARSDCYLEVHGVRPSVFLANIGPPSVHTARATFAKNLFEVVGIRALSDDRPVSPDDAGVAFSTSGARLACLCSSDAVYAESASDMARALKAAGAERVYLAGRPGDHRAAWEAAGVDEFVYQGCDRLDVLTRALDTAGVS